ncbi:MAG: hypothetical protein AAF629_02090 [Chloroflexota bacterium]
MNVQKVYKDASHKTAGDLKDVAHSMRIQNLSRLSLPEINAVVEQVSQVVPAGNVPAVILNGLARISGRKIAIETIQRDIDLLFRGVEQALDKAAYALFFAGPAAVIWGYQNLLKLTGREPEDAFPEGTWQFYVDYALREDTARHTCETRGFDATLQQHRINLSQIDRLTAWIMSAVYTLHQYDDLLENEWRERVYTYSLRELTGHYPDSETYSRIYQAWEKQRPYQRTSEARATEPYPAFRRRKFDEFLDAISSGLPPQLYKQWLQAIEINKRDWLPLYLQQMSILAHLEPNTYSEVRVPLTLNKTHIALIYQGRYYLLPICTPDTDLPVEVETVREQIATMLAAPSDTPTQALNGLVSIKRTELIKLWSGLPAQTTTPLEALNVAPIVLNFDAQSHSLPLATIRQAERSLGNHALTIFDASESFVFDQSHIFFDGIWGASLAEIMTNEALSWAVYLNSLPEAIAGDVRPYTLPIRFSSETKRLIQQAPTIRPETAAETDIIDLEAIQALRSLFKQRNDLIRVTVNDLLILYRAIHAATYQPSPALVTNLNQLLAGSPTQWEAAQTVLEQFEKEVRINPAMLIPVDASQRAPKDRVYPVTFEVPLEELDLLNLYTRTLEALTLYQKASDDDTALYTEFDHYQREFLATIAGFGEVMSRTKEIALMGKSASVGSIKLLAHIPAPLQQMLHAIPNSLDILNDLIKGREVFSNLGMVADGSSLARFMTAKDDNAQKTLAWGVCTDRTGTVNLSLRDFRPHVSLFIACGQKAVATQITQDYLNTYAEGLNQFIRDLQRITIASRDLPR